MGVSAKKLASAFIGEAMKSDPMIRPRIFRKAAATFAHAANDPKNKHARQHLTAIGLEFAGAATQAATTNDFTQLLRDTATAWEQLGPDAEFSMNATQDAQALTRGIAASSDPGLAPRVSFAPESWSIDATLGRSAMVTWQPTAAQIQAGIQQSQTVAFWQGKKQEAQAMTIELTMVAPPVNPQKPHRGGGGPNQTVRPFATIQYGVDGNTQYSVPVDVGQGRRVTVPANYISVNVSVDDPAFDNADPVPISLGASIGMFQAGSVTPVTRTVAAEVPFGGLESDFLVIPVRASRLLPPVCVLGALPGGLSFQINWCRLSGQVIGQVSYDYTTLNAGSASQPVVVPYDAFFFTVQGTVNTDIRFPFELSL